MFNKILVALDIREIDRSAFNQVLSLAKTTGAKLMLLNVIAPDENNYPNPFVYSGYENDWTNESLITVYQEHWSKFKQQGLEALRSLAEEAKAAAVLVGRLEEGRQSDHDVRNLGHHHQHRERDGDIADCR